MDQDLIQQITDALAGHDWVTVAVAGVALIVPIVLKVMGKEIPVVEPALKAAVAWVKGRKPAPKAPEVPVGGLADVVNIKDQEPEKPK